MARMVVVAMVVCLLGVANGMVKQVTEGVCPTVNPKQDLDPAPYLGRWYEIERYSILWEGFQDCVNAIYSDLGLGVLEVHNTARKESGEFTEIYGTAVVYEPGVLLVEFPGHPPATYIVLDTDYENFSAVYNCEQVGNTMFQYAWVLSRTMTMDAATLATAEQAFIDNGIDLSPFSKTYQGDDCPYPE